jgi:plastocyanin domain-containing protein
MNKFMQSCKMCLRPRYLIPILIVIVALIIIAPKIGLVSLIAFSPLLLCGVMCGGMAYMMMKGDKSGGEKAVEVSDSVSIVVEHGYTPRVIAIPQGKTTKLNFIRTDSGSCQEELVIKDFNVKKFLPLNQKVTIEITPQQKGEFEYACGMDMYRGKIMVV